MYKNNFKEAWQEANKIGKELPDIKNIIFDDWRGWRFIFDTGGIRYCQHDCSNCRLFKLLNQVDSKSAYTSLIKAEERDQMLFGQENFLNCKSLEEYKNCYIRFILEKTNNQKEIQTELSLLMDMKILYSSSGRPRLLERQFKQAVIMSVLASGGRAKEKIIRDYLASRRLSLLSFN